MIAYWTIALSKISFSGALMTVRFHSEHSFMKNKRKIIYNDFKMNWQDFGR
jgi:hypothetical protein